VQLKLSCVIFAAVKCEQMKMNKSLLLPLSLLILIGIVCRVAGFAPQIAMAVFGAAVIKDKRLAFILPLLSMLLSDVIYQVLYVYGYMDYPGFYKGQSFFDSQWLNYILLAALTLFGFWARTLSVARIVGASLAAPLFYFVISNFMVWIGGAGFVRPKTFDGLMQCYADGLPFLRSSVENTLVFSAMFFVSYFLLQRFVFVKKQLA
jgi:hypothetical protein